jgi:hypothetical protein
MSNPPKTIGEIRRQLNLPAKVPKP